MKWFKYEVDYEYGVGTLLTRKQPKDPLALFYDLANQCFGIRKSLGEVKIKDESWEELPETIVTPKDTTLDRHPDLDNPLQRLVANMSRNYDLTPPLVKKSNYILYHSGGDLVAWDKKNHKVKSEWDDL